MAFSIGCEITLHSDEAQTTCFLGIVQFGSSGLNTCKGRDKWMLNWNAVTLKQCSRVDCHIANFSNSKRSWA